MKAFARAFFRVLFVLLLPGGWALPSFAAKAPLLRYRAEAKTNVFSVQIEIRGENGKETLTGTIITFTRPAASNFISLSFRGSLQPKRDATVMPAMNRPSRWLMPIQMTEGCELLLDAQGRILRTSGDFPLPTPLGSVAQLFVPPLPGKADAKWEFSEDLAVLDEPFGLGPTLGFGWAQNNHSMMYSFGSMRNNMSAIIIVSQRTKAERKSTDNATVTVHQRLVLDSPLLIDVEPRISANGEGSWTFDVAGGFLRTCEMEYQALLNSDSSTRRSTSKLKVQILEGKEREAALAVQSPRQIVDPDTGQVVPRKLSGEELQKVFADLQSDDDTRSRAAANRLASSELSNPPQALVNYLTNHLFATDSPLRFAAIRVVADFGTAEHVPDLLRVLKTSDSSASWSAIRGLGRLKDPRAIEPLVECVASGGSEAHQAATALENFGPAAEEAVLRLLKEKHTNTKRAACGILRKIGTQKSVEPLKELVIISDFSLNSAASEALRAIQGRL